MIDFTSIEQMLRDTEQAGLPLWGFPALLSQMGLTVGILVLLLICYFISTWILFRHSACLD